jgi:MYXO-CTERM domain-containing protein
MYGISQELTVGPVPSPGALALLGAAGLLRRRRRG